MKRRNLLIALSLLAGANTWAEDLPKDTLKVVDIEEVVVIGSPKENRKLREQPLAATILSQKDMQAAQVTSMKSLTGVVPNLYIPDYGSRITSAVYIRGIGSRINTPAVGLYVDNMPYIDKSAFDFNYSDVERIDVLRGPQATLYGRNTMGGLIKVYTKSPFNYQGTDVRLSAATYNTYNASLTHYHRASEKFAFSAGGFYEYDGGFFENSTTGKKADQGNSVGGRLRGIYLPTANLKIDLNVSYEYDDQGGYPYYYTGAVNGTEETFSEGIGKISANQESRYRRNMLNSGMNVEYQAKHFILSSVTGYQYLNDRMFLDQDFIAKDYFNLTQKQRSNMISEELVMKSKPGKNWQWTTGAFGFYQSLNTDAPVTFNQEGVADIIEGNTNSIFKNLKVQYPNMPTLGLKINNPSLYIASDFDTPTLSGALYHQSTFNNLLVKGLSFTAGLRLDYEKLKIKYNSVNTTVNYDFNLNMTMGGRTIMDLTDNVKAPSSLTGEMSNDYLQWLPKFALQYEWKPGNNVYATASRGYRSGGYNVQAFSDLAQKAMKNGMKDALLKSEVFAKAASMIEEYWKSEVVNPEAETYYKPEYTWNYEVGSHLTLWNGKLQADLAAFYMDTKDQQIAKFVESGLGRMIVNAGKSRSIGAEASVRTNLTDAFSINLNYGYTYATFTDYTTNEKTSNPAYKDKGGLKDVSYDGNYVPFVPKHTFSLGGQYIFRLSNRYWLDEVQLNADYTGAGRIYWTEQNTASQPFYGTLNGRIAFAKGPGQIAFWVKNALDKQYDTFYFESMNRGFEQKGRPMQIGVDVRCRF